MFSIAAYPDSQQMAIENPVANDFWSTFVNSINVFNCRISGVVKSMFRESAFRDYKLKHKLSRIKGF